MKRAFRGVDIVIHTASLVNIGESLADQKKLKEINVDGTENVINSCIESNVKGLVYTSSREVVCGWGRNQLNIDESKERETKRRTTPAVPTPLLKWKQRNE